MFIRTFSGRSRQRKARVYDLGVIISGVGDATRKARVYNLGVLIGATATQRKARVYDMGVIIGGAAAVSGIYWGARIDGQFYLDHYGSPSATDAPWAGNVVGGPWDLFEQHAGKKVTCVHWGGPGLSLPSSFDTTANQRTRDRGAFTMYSMGASVSEINDLAATSNTNGVLTKVDNWATTVAAQGYPIMLRPLWEMNGNWGWPWQTAQGTTTAKYKQAWQTLHTRISAIAPNVSFAWCPNITDATVPDPSAWFPGTSVVDWMLIDGYVYGNYVSAAGRFDATLDILRALAPGKPLGIAEMGVAAPTGAPGKAAWVTEFLSTYLPARPDIKLVVWFNETSNPTWPHIEVGDAATTFSGAAEQAFRNGIASPYYKANIVNTVTFPSGAKVPIP